MNIGPWVMLGFGWLIVCILLAVFALGKGVMNSLTWLLFGGALLAFHMQMQSAQNGDMDKGVMGGLGWLIMLFSFILCLWAWSYALKRSFKSD